MKWFLVLSFAIGLPCLVLSRPGDGVELQKANIQLLPLFKAPGTVSQHQKLVPNYATPAYYPFTYNTIPVYQPAFGLTPVQVPRARPNPRPAPRGFNPVQAPKPKFNPKPGKEKSTTEPTTRAPFATRPPSPLDKLSDGRQERKLKESLVQSNGNKNAKLAVPEIIPVPPVFVPGLTSPYYVHNLVGLDNYLESVRQQFVREQRLPEGEQVKVEAVGQTSADRPVPDIPVNLFFQPYETVNEQSPNGKYASLILEPSAMSIVGSGGVAVSAPLSRAVVKKGVPTRVLFRPQSVAIAGAGGKAHAQADLILDYVE